MDVLASLVLNLVLFAVGMVVLYYVVRSAVRDGIGLADARRREAQTAEFALAEESKAEERAIQARLAREQTLREREVASPAESEGASS